MNQKVSQRRSSSMLRFPVTVIFLVLLVVIAQVAADPDCQVPFKPFPKREGLCYARLEDYDCALFNGTFLRNNCFVSAGQSFDYDKILLMPPKTTLLPLPAKIESPTFATTESHPRCKDVAGNCQEGKIFCAMPKYLSLMITNCAQTCGYCHCDYTPSKCGVTTTKKPTTIIPIPQCEDAASDCPSKKGYCKSNIYGKLMAKKCKSTCGYCSCTNSINNCSQLVQAGQCDKREHHGFMVQNCRQACGFC